MLNIKRPIEYLIYLGVPLLVYLFSGSYRLLISILSVDSMFSAINFLRSFMFNGLSEAKLVYESNCLYEVPTLRRYIYYLAITILYSIICNILWLDQIWFIKLTILYTVSPPILKVISDHYLHPFFQHIEYEQRRLLKNLICQQLANFLNFFADAYLGEKISLDGREFTKLFISYDQAMNQSLGLLKNILLTTAFRYGKKKMSRGQYRLVKMVYQFKTGNSVESFSAEEARNKVRTVLTEHQWNRLLDHDICSCIIKLYQIQEDDTNIWDVITEQLHYKTFSMFTVWFLSSFLGKTWLIGLSNLVIRWLRKGNEMFQGTENWFKILFVLIGTGIAYYHNSFLLGTFLAEFGYLLMVNRLTVMMRDQFLRRGRRILAVVHHENRYNLFLACSIGYFVGLGFLNTSNFYLAVINVLYLCLNLDDHFKQFVVGFITFTGLFSSYNYLHLMHNIYLCYLVHNAIVYLKHRDRTPVYTLENQLLEWQEKMGMKRENSLSDPDEVEELLTETEALEPVELPRDPRPVSASIKKVKSMDLSFCIQDDYFDSQEEIVEEKKEKKKIIRTKIKLGPPPHKKS